MNKQRKPDLLRKPFALIKKQCSGNRNLKNLAWNNDSAWIKFRRPPTSSKNGTQIQTQHKKNGTKNTQNKSIYQYLLKSLLMLNLWNHFITLLPSLCESSFLAPGASWSSFWWGMAHTTIKTSLQSWKVVLVFINQSSSSPHIYSRFLNKTPHLLKTWRERSYFCSVVWDCPCSCTKCVFLFLCVHSS